LYLTSPTSAGCAWNSFQQFKVTGTTALQMDLSGAGFVNLNTFITGILRTSAASNGTVATLTTSHQNTFMDVDASNYGTGTVKSWNVAGTSANNKWIGGLIDTPTGTLTGFTFAAGTVANKVIGMANNATTPYSSTGTPITDQTKEMYCDQNFNFFGEINLQTPAFGTSSPGINFYDTGNNGNQYIYSNSGFIKVGLDRTTGQFWLNPANGTIIAVANTAPPAGGTAGLGVRMSSTANFGVFFGSNAPSLSAAKGSLYLRTNGSGTTDRMYVNTDGGTTWTAVTTVA
jgi:hypothetical protein